VYPEVEQQPVTGVVEALQGRGSGEWQGRDSDSETGCLRHGGSRAGSAAGAPEEGSKVGDRSLRVSESIPVGSTSENLIAFESVSTPLGREAGVVGNGGEKRREEGVGEGLDASVTPGTPGMLMVDETRRSMGSLAN
jgi:hypothetical protein